MLSSYLVLTGPPLFTSSPLCRALWPRGNRESLDVNADNRLPASHRFLFLINSLLLSAAPVYLFSQIFDMAIPENAIVFGGVSVVSAVMLTMACQLRSKGLVARLINKRGIELASSIQLKIKDSQDEKAKLRLKVTLSAPSLNPLVFFLAFARSAVYLALSSSREYCELLQRDVSEVQDLDASSLEGPVVFCSLVLVARLFKLHGDESRGCMTTFGWRRENDGAKFPNLFERTAQDGLRGLMATRL